MNLLEERIPNDIARTIETQRLSNQNPCVPKYKSDQYKVTQYDGKNLVDLDLEYSAIQDSKSHHLLELSELSQKGVSHCSDVSPCT